MFSNINPYNVLRFDKFNNDRLKECVLYCPPELLPFQIPVSNTDANFSFKIVDLNGNEFTPSSGTLTTSSFNDSTKYVSFMPSTVEISSEGIYQIKFESDEAEYWSNAICIRYKYKQANSVSLSCIGNSGAYTMTLTPSSKADYTTFQIDYGTGFEMLGQDTGQWGLSEVGVGLSFDLPIKATFVYGNETIVKNYTASYDASDPCGTKTLTLNSTYSTSNYSAVYIEFWNTNDVQEKNLIFQDGYKQRFYFDAKYAYPGKVEEESFLSLYDGELTLESAAEADQVNIDFYPMPDHLLTALGQARYFDNVNIIDIHTGESTALQNFRLTSVQAEGSRCQAGRITAEINRSFIKSCETDKTPV